jgi:hypothetical protein
LIELTQYAVSVKLVEFGAFVQKKEECIGYGMEQVSDFC